MFNFSWPLKKEKGLGARLPEDKPYADKYPLALGVPSTATPGVLGCNWYSNFDNPKLDGTRWWIGRGALGEVRGGHAICVLPGNALDQFGWWRFYDQGMEGACVGFSFSRSMSLLNTKRYDGRWLYKNAQLVDEWEDTPPEEGTSLDAGARVLMNQGHKGYRRLPDGSFIENPVSLLEGISAYRWAASVDEVLSTLQSPVADQLGAIPLLNSWGVNYPRKVWLPGETLDRLLNEYGEVCFFSDR